MSELIDYKNGQFHIENCDVESLIERFSSPLYVYSKGQILKNWCEFQQYWPAPHKLCYAVKANSNLAILQLLAEHGAGFDIVSGGELQRVLMAGGKAGDVVFSGVAKSKDEIIMALEAGIGCFNVESEAELERIQDIAAAMDKQASVSIRVNPDVDAKTHPYIATGMKANKFGISMSLAKPVFLRAHNLPNINLIGADCHIGSQIMTAEPFLDAAQRMFNLVSELEKEGINLTHLDLGGGFGVAYQPEEPLDKAFYLKELVKLAENYPQITMVLEPGRAITADAGVLLTTVEYIKPSEDKNFVLVDAGMNDLIRPSLYQAWHDILPAHENKRGGDQLNDIVGPVCETGDFFGHARHLNVQQGDVLAIKHAGAYGFTMASNYNSRGRPPEVLVSGDNATLIRERESFNDLVRGEHLLHQEGK
ncbi:diaminopimelate decarboxylase [Idiomarina sp. M1R2S28]|uniref:Diaminopimelate decarboxylase n=1 Tax=Idiomarina rhizosphaerae TaxID=2961572 RepID=A0A9X2JRP4_9GAMM|nr:diaminopimelate decarboxylase [Idiomarina rhizosphaerae]MCP1339058.1 diaminopimelate decarboxylase [Idiomarina rhizosphaerae]